MNTSLVAAADAMNLVTYALSQAEQTPGLGAASIKQIAEVFEEAHQLREKLLAINDSIGTGKIRISRLPPEPEET